MKKKVIAIFIAFLIIAGCQTTDENTDELSKDPLDEKAAVEKEGDEEASEEVSLSIDEDKPQVDITEMESADWTVETITEDLRIPWDINMIDQMILLTERDGNIVIIEDGESMRYSFETSDPIVHQGEGGLLGMELSPDFTDTQDAYFYYTYEGDSGLVNKVVKGGFNGEVWEETEVLLDQIPGDRVHNGGRIAIGTDNYLYVTTGDANVRELSQDTDNLAGSILRMDLNGEIPSDNPFEDSYIYSFGHRNPQGLAWNDDGVMYSSEHGPTGHDEINIIEPGKNYGWPVIIGDEEEDGMEKPRIHSGEDTWAPAGIAFYEDNLIIAGLRGQSLYVYNEVTDSMDVIFTTEGRLRDVIVFDGDIYLLTNNTDGRGSPTAEDDRLLKLLR